jgi:predicted glycogen debranching enzyme
LPLDLREWLETDGLGGYAMGTAAGVRTRRYHGLLVAATRPPAGRMVLVADLEVSVETAAGTRALSSHRYAGGALYPDGASRLASFSAEPWPAWRHVLEDGTCVEQEVLVAPGAPRVVVRWRRTAGEGPALLRVRPLLAGRDHHALHHENPGFRFDPREVGAGTLRFAPYPGVPALDVRASGPYAHAPEWYRSFLLAEEAARGFEATEDLASPGAFTLDLAAGPAALVFSASLDGAAPPPADAVALADALAAREAQRRARFPSALHRAADAYLVRRGAGRTVVAGYPWFTDWGRDTFIALRGLCLVTGRLEEARDVALSWAGALSRGMLPNRFPESGEAPEYNAVDSALWFVVAAGDLLGRAGLLSAADAARLRDAVLAVVDAHATGTRAGIRADADGLLACGAPGTQLTWMDAVVGHVPVTPRVGKPVEVQALWVNALAVAARLEPRWEAALSRARASFPARFWDPARGCLHDVVDCDHRPGAVDPSFRPNQILAAGGLPLAILDPARARRVVDAVEARLWTPAGLRTLAPDDPRYRGRYAGDPAQRDGAYHQGTAWPWLAAPFVDAWVRVRGGTPDAIREARRRFLAPLLAAAGALGLGHLPELADGDPPHAPGGCPFQAWSVAAALQLRTALGDAAGGAP